MIYMNDRAFLDTNILVYAYDQNDPVKQKKAQELITTGIEQENLVLSVQVLGEFFNVVTRRIPQPVTSDEAREIITSMCILPVQEIDLSMVNRAIDTHEKYQIAYWDALIISAAHCRVPVARRPRKIKPLPVARPADKDAMWCGQGSAG